MKKNVVLWSSISGGVLIAIVAIIIAVVCANNGAKNSDTNSEDNNGGSSVVVDGGDSGSKTGKDGNDGQNGNDSQDADNFEIKEEDGKVIIKLGEITTQVYYHDGEKVTDYEVYLEWKSHKEAEEMLGYYETLAEEDETIDSIKVMGQYLVYNYNEEGFGGIETYEDLVDYAKTFNVLVEAAKKAAKEAADEEFDLMSGIELPMPENCEILSTVEEADGIKMFVEWEDLQAARDYRLAVKQAGEYGTVEEVPGFFAFQGVTIRISYDEENAENNYVLFYE